MTNTNLHKNLRHYPFSAIAILLKVRANKKNQPTSVWKSLKQFGTVRNSAEQRGTVTNSVEQFVKVRWK